MGLVRFHRDFFFQAEDGIRDGRVTGVQTCALPIFRADRLAPHAQQVALLGETLLETVLATAEASPPTVMIVDSIQTIFTGELEGEIGRASCRERVEVSVVGASSGNEIVDGGGVAVA